MNKGLRSKAHYPTTYPLTTVKSQITKNQRSLSSSCAFLLIRVLDIYSLMCCVLVSSPDFPNMSRMFATSSRRIKELKWKLNGTTEDVSWVKNLLNEAVDQAPGLAGKVDSGIIK